MEKFFTIRMWGTDGRALAHTIKYTHEKIEDIPFSIQYFIIIIN